MYLVLKYFDIIGPCTFKLVSFARPGLWQLSNMGCYVTLEQHGLLFDSQATWFAVAETCKITSQWSKWKVKQYGLLSHGRWIVGEWYIMNCCVTMIYHDMLGESHTAWPVVWQSYRMSCCVTVIQYELFSDSHAALPIIWQSYSMRCCLTVLKHDLLCHSHTAWTIVWQSYNVNCWMAVTQYEQHDLGDIYFKLPVVWQPYRMTCCENHPTWTLELESSTAIALLCKWHIAWSTIWYTCSINGDSWIMWHIMMSASQQHVWLHDNQTTVFGESQRARTLVRQLNSMNCWYDSHGLWIVVC